MCARFLDLASIVGGDVALYCFCAVYNLPFVLSGPVHTWEEYVASLAKRPGAPGFIDGETDVQLAVASGMSERERWEMVWGVGDPDHPYTTQDYRFLDNLFRMYSVRLDAAGGMDAQQEDVIRDCCKSRLLADKARASGTKDGVSIYATLNKTIQDNLSAENLRRKDAKPIENARADGIVDALQKKYGIGMEMTAQQFLEIFYKWCNSHQYPETVDAAEQSLLAIINTTRENNDLPQIPVLPQSARLEDYESEFAVEPNDLEMEAYDYLGLTRPGGEGG